MPPQASLDLAQQPWWSGRMWQYFSLGDKRLQALSTILIRVASCRISDSDKQHWRGRRSRQASLRSRCVPCLLNKVDRQRPTISSAVLHARSGPILSCLYSREPIDCIVKSGFKCESRKTLLHICRRILGGSELRVSYLRYALADVFL